LPTDPLTGARYPSSGDSPNIAQYIQNAVNDLSDDTCPSFSTTTARNTAYTNWVSAGNTMRNGLQCSVVGYPQIYRAGGWHGTAAQVVSTATVDTTLRTATADVMTLSVADPGYSYRLQCSASVLLSVIGAGVTVAAYVVVNGSVINPVGGDLVGPANNMVAAPVAPPVSGTLTGASTVALRIFKTGTAGNGYQPATGSYNILSAVVMPV
jgi:hypothetical protein